MAQRVFPSLAAYLRDRGRGAQVEVAAELGISPAYLSLLKDRQRQPPLDLALRIAAHCAVPLESLVRLAPARKAS
jgi:transcriptional regulator with XRE-family HTH domain